MATPQTDPFATASQDGAAPIAPQNTNENIAKGKPSRNLRTVAVAFLGIAIIAYMLLPTDRKQLKAANKLAEEPVAGASTNDKPGAMLVRDLQSSADNFDSARRQAVSQTQPASAPVASSVSLGMTQAQAHAQAPNPMRGKDAAMNVEDEERAARIAHREAVIASPMEAVDVQLKDGSFVNALTNQMRGGSTSSEIIDAVAKSDEALMARFKQNLGDISRPVSGTIPANAGSGTLRKSQDTLFVEKHVNERDPGVVKTIKQRNGPTLYEGTLIRTALDRGINTDLPGRIRAHVISDVYDSINQRVLIVPRGSIVIGEYSTGLVVGQSRVLVAMTRLILPNGKSIPLLGTPAADMQGVSGMPAEIDNHFWKMFGSSLMVGAVSLLLPSSQQTVGVTNNANGSSTTSGSIVGQSLSETLQTLAARNKNIYPTGTVEAGQEFMLSISRDVVMSEQ